MMKKTRTMLAAAAIVATVGAWVALMFPDQVATISAFFSGKLYWYVVIAFTFYAGLHWRALWRELVYSRVTKKNEDADGGRGDELPIAVCYKWGSKDWRGRRQCLQLVLMVKRNVGWDHKEYIPGRGVVEYMTEDRDSTTTDDVDMPAFMRRISFDVQCVKVSSTKHFDAHEIPGNAVGWARFYLKINSYRVQTAEQLHAHLAPDEVDFLLGSSARVMDDRLVADAIDRGLMPDGKDDQEPPENEPEPESTVTDIGGYRSRRS